MNKRCDTCGRSAKHDTHCDLCRTTLLEWDAQSNDIEYMFALEAHTPSCIIVWADTQTPIWSLLAQWPGFSEVIEPIEPGDSWGTRLSLTRRDLGTNPHAEFTIVNGKLTPCVSLAQVFTCIVVRGR